MSAMMDEDALGRPGEISIHDAKGSRILDPVHQSGHRLTWLKAHALLEGASADDPAPLAEGAAEVLQAFA
jgi:hypothetical protein